MRINVLILLLSSTFMVNGFSLEEQFQKLSRQKRWLTIPYGSAVGVSTIRIKWEASFLVSLPAIVSDQIRSVMGVLTQDPCTSTMMFQLIIAFAVPLDFPNQDVLLSYNIEGNYNLPDELKYFGPSPAYDLNSDPVLADATRSLRSVTRKNTYQMCQNRLESFGFNGRACILKMICEMNQTALEHNGLIGQLLHILLTSIWIFQLIQMIVISDCFSRDKRQLIYPPQSIMQLAFGVVTPAQVKGRQIATNMGFMFNIDLPTNVSMWYPYRTDYRRKRSADSDQALYSLMENVLSMNGLDGRACLQKSICQMRDVPAQSDNMLFQILNLVFGFNHHTTSFLEPQLHNTSCDQVYPTCQHTPVDLFLELYSSSWNPIA